MLFSLVAATSINDDFPMYLACTVGAILER
jgi:hypothetical protein